MCPVGKQNLPHCLAFLALGSAQNWHFMPFLWVEWCGFSYGWTAELLWLGLDRLGMGWPNEIFEPAKSCVM